MGAVIVATNDVAGIYRANVGGCFSTQEIVIISRPVQLVLREVTKRKEGVSFGRTENLSGESAANRKREADWRRRRKGVITLVIVHNAETRKRRREKEKQTEEGPENFPKRTEETGTGLKNFGPSHVGSTSHCSLIASLGFVVLYRNHLVTHTAGGVGCAGGEVGARSEGRLKLRSVVSAQRA